MRSLFTTLQYDRYSGPGNKIHVQTAVGREFGGNRKTGVRPPHPVIRLYLHSTGRKYPATEVTIQIITAIMRALNQPIV